MSTFMLVHGAWHGAWCWRKLIAELEALGHKPIAFDLPSHGEDRTPARDVTLDDYVAKVVAELDASQDRVLLVGHSMGGIVITAAAEQRPQEIERLVYLTALLPRNRESLTDLEGRNPHPTVPPNMVPSSDQKTVTLKDESIIELFYHDCSPADQAYGKAHLSLQALEPVARKVRTTAENFGQIPRAYIECTKDKAISLALQRMMVEASPCDKVISLGTSHSPFFSAPKELAAALASLAEG